MLKIKKLYMFVLMLAFAVALSGCGDKPKNETPKVETISSVLKLSENEITLTHPKTGFSAVFMGDALKEGSPEKQKYEAYRDSGIVTRVSSMLTGPGYAMIVTLKDVPPPSWESAKARAAENAARNGYKEVKYGGITGYKINDRQRVSTLSDETYPVVLLPVDNNKAVIEIKLLSTESIGLIDASFKKEAAANAPTGGAINASTDPVIKKAAEENRQLFENKEVQTILNSFKLNTAKK